MTINSLPLWQLFIKKATPEQTKMLQKLVEYASNLLNTIPDTFPTYTLHNSTHSRNVIRVMGELLGEELEEVTALEGILLILSAYFHDIGMVFQREEREQLRNEEEFNIFLNKFPAAKLEIHSNENKLTPYVAEWYCRWRHPERVYRLLEEIDGDLKWGVTPLKTALGTLCESHGKGIDFLLNDDTCRTDYLAGQADIRFCGILLRLADILDFDNSRSPEEIYRYLELEKRDSQQKQTSNIEWLKHLCSDGFCIPTSKREERYEINIIAAPMEPSIEHDLRQFIDIIEAELDKCNRVLPKCSNRWRDFTLPYRVNRSDIQSRNYKYGEHRFTLDQEQVLELLMGENLYSDPFVFIRELLQNSIDTCRHRQFYEESIGNTNYEPKVEIYDWVDEEGYRWIRIDDNGMGMNEEKITKYLLKVGNSFYNSNEFKAEKLSYLSRSGQDFTPISRFGIGILSCFMVGDRVEINTRHVLDGEACRLSLPGLHGFYTLQLKQAHHSPLAMPSEKIGTWKDSGTSIAVRIDPRKETHIFDINESLRKHVIYPPVPVFFRGIKLGVNPDFIEKPRLKKPITNAYPQRTIEELSIALDYHFLDIITYTFIPLDLTKHSPTKNLKGQVIIWLMNISVRDTKNLELLKKEWDYKMRRHRWPYLEISPPENEIFEKNIPLHSGIEEFPKELRDFSPKVNFFLHNGMNVSHTSFLDDAIFNIPLSDTRFIHHQIGLSEGIFSLYDELRPNVSLDREKLISIPWHIYSIVSLAFVRAIRHSPVPIDHITFDLIDSRYIEETPLKTILQDKYIVDIDNEFWKSERIIDTPKGKKSALEILHSIQQGKKVVFNDFYKSWWEITESFTVNCISALIQLNIGIQHDAKKNIFFADNKTDIKIQEGEKLFRPLKFIPSNDVKRLVITDIALNKKHPVSQWFIRNAHELHEKYTSMFHSLEYNLKPSLHLSYKEVNQVFARLREIAPHIAPPKEFDLKKSDFEE